MVVDKLLASKWEQKVALLIVIKSEEIEYISNGNHLIKYRVKYQDQFL